eukprot:1926770-Pleurochrysis_carterae.AAC.2
MIEEDPRLQKEPFQAQTQGEFPHPTYLVSIQMSETLTARLPLNSTANSGVSEHAISSALNPVPLEQRVYGTTHLPENKVLDAPCKVSASQKEFVTGPLVDLDHDSFDDITLAAGPFSTKGTFAVPHSLASQRIRTMQFALNLNLARKGLHICQQALQVGSSDAKRHIDIVTLQEYNVHRQAPRTIEYHNRHATNTLGHELILAPTTTLNQTGGPLILISLHFETAEQSSPSLTRPKDSIRINSTLPTSGSLGISSICASAYGSQRHEFFLKMAAFVQPISISTGGSICSEDIALDTRH